MEIRSNVPLSYYHYYSLPTLLLQDHRMLKNCSTFAILLLTMQLSIFLVYSNANLESSRLHLNIQSVCKQCWYQHLVLFTILFTSMNVTREVYNLLYLQIPRKQNPLSHLPIILLTSKNLILSLHRNWVSILLQQNDRKQSKDGMTLLRKCGWTTKQN